MDISAIRTPVAVFPFMVACVNTGLVDENSEPVTREAEGYHLPAT